GTVVADRPAALSRAVDPRAGFSLVWGRVSASSASNVIPDDAVAEGTGRCLEDEAWHAAPDLVKKSVDSVTSAYGAEAEVTYRRGVPPTINEATCVEIMREAVTRSLGDRKSTRLNSSHVSISYAVFCLKKKNKDGN